MPHLRECLDSMGIPLWQRRAGVVFPGAGDRQEAAPSPEEKAPSVSSISGLMDSPQSGEALRSHAERGNETGGRGNEEKITWDSLRAQVAACTACPLSQARKQTVFGVGSLQAEWLLVGEAPGEEEDARGEPFVGRAGQLLDAMLRAVGKAREEVYIANVAKCRPPGNRTPSPQEMAACGPFLAQQIALLKPRLIIALGAVAARALLQDDAPLWKVRGRLHHYQNIPLAVTYHPAYLLRKPSEKRKAWEDWRFILGIGTDSEPGG